MKNKKQNNITFRLENDLFKKYKKICDERGYNLSKRLRIWIEKEIEFDSNNKDILNIFKE